MGRLLRLIRDKGLLRSRDLALHGLPREYLKRLEQIGVIEQAARGVYRLPHSDLGEKDQLAMAGTRVPRGVVCLLSALSFHNLTTQTPFEVWMAIPDKARLPQKGGMPLRLVRFSGSAYSAGIEEHRIGTVPVKVYGVAKTVADCFKYRNKLGLDIALEALREAWKAKKCTMDELWRSAKICRVANVMRPYLEAVA